MAMDASQSAMLFVGAGVNYGGELVDEDIDPNRGKVVSYKVNLSNGWASAPELVQEFTPGDGCTCVEWVTLHESGKSLYAFCSYWRFRPISASELQAGHIIHYSIDGPRLTQERKLLSGGHQPCHAVCTADLLAVAHYLDGVVALWHVDPADGRLVGDAPQNLFRLPGEEIEGPRLLGTNTGALAHGVTFSPCGHWLLAVDAGQGVLQVWNLEARDAAPRASELLDSKSRPRHCVFSKDATQIYVVHEAANVVTLHSFTAGEVSGALVTSPMLTEGTTGWHCASEIVLLPELNMLAATMRAVTVLHPAGKESTVSLFNATTLDRVAILPAGRPVPIGDPRHAVALPSELGGGLLVGLTYSEQLCHFVTDGDASMLPAEHEGDVKHVIAPLCLAVLPVLPQTTGKL